MLMLFKPKNRRENLHRPFGSTIVHDRNRSGVGELVGREPLMFARVENIVINFSQRRRKCQNFRSETQTAFFNGNFNFFGRGNTSFGGI